eukprot:UN03441
MRVLQHVVTFVLDKFEEKDMERVAKQVDKMEKVIPGIICATFNENRIDYYQGYEDRRRGNNYTLLIIFEEEKAMQVYMDHNEHTAFKKLVGPFLQKDGVTVVDFYQDNFPEFAVYGHTMMSKAGPASAKPGGFSSK